jgi:hypothetical protein
VSFAEETRFSPLFGAFGRFVSLQVVNIRSCIFAQTLSLKCNFELFMVFSKPQQFVSAVLLALSTMLRLGLPHVNILSKVFCAFLILSISNIYLYWSSSL